MQKQKHNKRGGSGALAFSDFSSPPPQVAETVQTEGTMKGGSGCPLAANPPSGMYGGSGAADYAIDIYGNTDSQHSVSGSNVIAMNNPNAAQVPINGGKRGGRGIITDVAVPALLLYANNTFKRNKYLRKSRKSRTNRKSRKSRRRRR